MALTFFTSAIIGVLFFAIPAFADMEVDVGIDEQGEPAPTGETGEVSINYGYVYDVYNTTYDLNCNNWNGNSRYQMKTNCQVNTSAANIPILSTGAISSSVHYNGGVYVVGEGWSSPITLNDTCAPGTYSAYGIKYARHTEKYDYYQMVEYKRPKQKPYWVSVPTGKHHLRTNISKASCLYPTEQLAETRFCYYGYRGSSYFTRSHSQIKSSGNQLNQVKIKDRGVRAGDPRAPIWTNQGYNSVAPICDETRGAYVKMNQALNEGLGYGYYRLWVAADVSVYQHMRLVGGGKTFADWWRNSNNYATSNTNFFAYSCRNTNNPLEGPYTSGGLPDVNRYFEASTCPQVTWRCELNDSTTAGLNRSAIPAGRTYVSDTATVMRNGEETPLTFATLRVVDYTNGNRRDVTNGGAGNGVRNITNIQYRNLVKNGSTPFYGTDPNNEMQYFKLHTNTNGAGREKFNTWLNNHNSNLNKSISFSWASDNSNSPFQIQRQYRVTADFYVPRLAGSGVIDQNGNGASRTFEWVRGTRDCLEYNSSTGQLIPGSMLTSTSNPIEVVRAVNR